MSTAAIEHFSIARSELILGGQKSGKSRRAELLTNWLMPVESTDADQQAWATQSATFLRALREAPGPVILVGNEIGLGVIPMGREVRAFVDALGVLNQQVAGACFRVTLMVAGLPLSLKDE